MLADWPDGRAGRPDLVARPRPGRPPGAARIGDVPAVTRESTALSKALKKRGLRFVGPTTAYALMQACGLVDDHLVRLRGPRALSDGPQAPLPGRARVLPAQVRGLLLGEKAWTAMAWSSDAPALVWSSSSFSRVSSSECDRAVRRGTP